MFFGLILLFGVFKTFFWEANVDGVVTVAVIFIDQPLPTNWYRSRFYFTLSNILLEESLRHIGRNGGDSLQATNYITDFLNGIIVLYAVQLDLS